MDRQIRMLLTAEPLSALRWQQMIENLRDFFGDGRPWNSSIHFEQAGGDDITLVRFVYTDYHCEEKLRDVQRKYLDHLVSCSSITSWRICYV